MPIVVTFDLFEPRPGELNRLRGAFERFGWERLGNTVYRYPPLGNPPEAEDWFNCVVPALMILRAYARYAARTQRGLSRFTIDAQSMTGFDHEGDVGVPPLASEEIDFPDPSMMGGNFSRRRLQDWLDGITWPYAEQEPGGAAP